MFEGSQSHTRRSRKSAATAPYKEENVGDKVPKAQWWRTEVLVYKACTEMVCPKCLLSTHKDHAHCTAEEARSDIEIKWMSLLV